MSESFTSVTILPASRGAREGLGLFTSKSSPDPGPNFIGTELNFLPRA